MSGRATGGIVGVVLGVVLLVSSPSGAAYGAAARDCTFVGGPGPDSPVGTDGRDVLCTGAGNDVIKPSAGNDVIYAGGGRDLVYGGDGKDRVYGGGGGDLLDGGGQGDRMYGGGGNDTMRGSAGLDRLWGESGRDNLDGGDDDIADVLRGGADADRAARSPNDQVKSAVLGYSICVTEWIPCTTTNSWPRGVIWEVTNQDDCGGSNGPTSVQWADPDLWNCGGYTGSFDYLEPVTGDRFYVYSYTPQVGIFRDPYIVCAFTDYETAGAGTPVPSYACAPDYTGNGEWPFSTLNLVDQGDTTYGLAAGQTCDVQTPGALTACPGIGEMQASNEGAIYVLNNASSAVEVSLTVNNVPYQTTELNGGGTLVTDIKAGASVMAELESGATAPGQILIIYVLSWGHDSVDALAGG